jgi:hypothetical protein
MRVHFRRGRGEEFKVLLVGGGRVLHQLNLREDRLLDAIWHQHWSSLLLARVCELLTHIRLMIYRPLHALWCLVSIGGHIRLLMPRLLRSMRKHVWHKGLHGVVLLSL